MKPINFLMLSLLITTASSCRGAERPKVETKAIGSVECMLDPELLHSWEVFEDLEDRPGPYSEIYTGCNKTLIYVAARHGNAPDGKTFQLIQKLVGEYEVDIAVLEGFSSDQGQNPANLIELASEMQGTPADAESLFTIRQIVEKGAIFTGGEPSDKQILDEISEDDFSPVDLLGFYIVRQIPQLIRQEKISDANDVRLRDAIFNMVGSFSSETGVPIEELQAVDGLESFYAWYLATNGVAFKENYRDQDSWPGVKSLVEPRTTNKISDRVANARDFHIIGIIDNALSEFDTVMVVYGFSHHTIQKPVLQAAFGEDTVSHR